MTTLEEGPRFTEQVVEKIFNGIAPKKNFTPHTAYDDLMLVFVALDVYPRWSWKKKGIALEITSYGFTSQGSDTEWEFGFHEGNELALEVSLYHFDCIQQSGKTLRSQEEG